jgi:hypothetical protein
MFMVQYQPDDGKIQGNTPQTKQVMIRDFPVPVTVFFAKYKSVERIHTLFKQVKKAENTEKYHHHSAGRKKEQVPEADKMAIHQGYKKRTQKQRLKLQETREKEIASHLFVKQALTLLHRKEFVQYPGE